MKSLEEWRKAVYDNLGNPNILSELGVKMSADYAYYKERYAILKIAFAMYSNKLKFNNETGKQLSDQSVENRWIATDEGQEYTQIKYKTEGLKQMNKAIESRIVTLSLEAKNKA